MNNINFTYNETVPHEKSGSDTGLIVRRIIAYVIFIFMCIISVFPFLALLINTTRSHNQIQAGFSLLMGKSFMDNLKLTMGNTDIPMFRGMINSFIVATGASIVSVYFSAFTAYGIYVYDFKLKKFANTFILLIMMVPTQVTTLGFILLLNRINLVNSFIPLIIPAIAAPATYYFMIQYMRSSLTLDIIEAARIDGSGEFRTFNMIIMPILKPAIAVQLIFAFVANWNNYFVPALILTDKNKKTLPVLIAMIRSADFLRFNMGQVYFSIAFSILPVIIVYLILSKFIIRGITLGSVKG